MAKAADPTEEIRKAGLRIAELEILLKQERDARQQREYLEKAAAFPALTGTREEIAEILKMIAGAPAGTQAVALRVLAAANEQIAKSGLFKELGHAGNAPDTAGSAFDRVEALAKAEMARMPSLTLSGAIERVALANPELYTAYREER